ncbi:DUF1102 domain-containing protein [Thermococcus sp. M39]|uniref:DUF1102 domain-containing protein n=1 Tax=unclassified Thermococcus TaxID=2627626 RepID=UPI00143A0A0E|nr:MULTISPECIES: DUF1102 domain-containing protein [unclassified Thermococcus]NJE09195.1 DUF1102 domain-containing protein [Thermococcus sp. M39]NJE13769.1 DUF1102 domain-containing protein [Thermococcus sp. LS2]
MNKLIGLALLLVGMMLAVGAGANFRYYEADRDIIVAIVADDNELIDLTPVQPYARLSNGKLYIDISEYNPNKPEWGGLGLSPNTTYVFEEMFNVSNDLWENNQTDFPICVTLSVSGSYDVKIFAGNYTSPTAGPAASITFTVYHGSPVPIGFVFNNTNMSPGSYQTQLQIHAIAGACT